LRSVILLPHRELWHLKLLLVNLWQK
jgi:hypothetical protein